MEDTEAVHDTQHRRWRLGVVSFLNAKPLIEGLDVDGSIELIQEVPALLPALLEQGLVDAALVPVIALFQHDRRWRIVSDACIGCDGETLTVRVFSRVEPGAVRRLHVDTDSHTSVALARIIWQGLYGCRLRIAPFLGHETVDDCEAILLIGDKVVDKPGMARLAEYNIETDLGSAWQSLTSLPFVFAAWAAPHGVDVTGLARRLSHARDLGVESAATIAAEFGPASGWPVELAKHYLTTRLEYTLGPRQRLGMAKFLELAKTCGLVGSTQALAFA